MTPFTSIVAPTDFSIDGNNAVRRAALLAYEHGARLKLVHVLDPFSCKPLRDWFSPSIDIVAARLARDGGLHVFHAINSHREAVLRDTDVPECLIRESRLRQEAGTLARMRRKAARLGLDGIRTSFSKARRRLLLGSVSRSVLVESVCDMLIVPRPRKEPVAHAASAPMWLAEPAAHADTAALAQSAAAFAGALAPPAWTESADRFLPRGVA